MKKLISLFFVLSVFAVHLYGQPVDRSWQAIADSLGNPSTEQARAILGTANVLTAAICSATGDTPGDVCGQPAVRALQGTLAQLAPPAGAR